VPICGVDLRLYTSLSVFNVAKIFSKSNPLKFYYLFANLHLPSTGRTVMLYLAIGLGVLSVVLWFFVGFCPSSQGAFERRTRTECLVAQLVLIVPNIVIIRGWDLHIPTGYYIGYTIAAIIAIATGLLWPND